MIRIFKLVLLLVVSQVAFGQAPSNYTNINGRYRWIAGMFDSTFHIPKGTTPSLRTGGSTNSGGLFYNTSDSSVYTYTGTQWIKVRGSLNPSDTTNKYITQVYKKSGSDSVFYVKGGIHTWAFNDSTGAAGGGGGGKIYYFNGGVNMGTFGGFTMYELGDTANTGVAANFTRATTGAIANFITDPNKPGLLQIPAGVWTIDAWLSESGGGANHAEIWAVLEKWNGSTITTIATSPIEEITEGNTPNLYTWAITVPTTTLAVTDRIIIQFYITNTNGKTVTLYTQNGYVGEVHTTFTTGIGALNGLSAPAQYLVTGTSGTDFNISSVTATHTFNLPTASATNRGALSTADWTTFNSKLSPADTVSLSNRINLKLNISDTAAMLSPYARTNVVNAGLATKVNISDTASMLSPYARKNFLNAGTGISYSSTTGTIANTAPDQTVALNAGTGISISGTYPNFTITNSSPSSGGTVTSVGSNTGTGLTGGPITTSGTLAIDTALISTRAWRQKGVDSLQANINLKLNISDTASMLSPYLRSNTAAATYVPQTRTITINGTSQDLSANRTFSVGTVTSVGSGYGLSGGAITGSGTLLVDSATLSNYYLRRKDSLTSTNLLGYVTRTVLADSAAAIRAAAGGGSIGGSGTINRLAKFTASGTIGNSSIADSSSSVAMTIRSNGNIGIGTSAPIAATGYTSLALNGGVGGWLQFFNGGTHNGEIFNSSNEFTMGSLTSIPLILKTNTIERMRILSSGQVVIGNGQSSATPATGIIEGTDGTGSNVAGAEFRIQGGQGTGSGAGGPITFYTSAAGSAGTTTNNAVERMSISSVGNVAITSVGTNSVGGKNQLTINAGTGAGVGIALNTTLAGASRRNWFIGTEENIDGDFVIKRSTAAGGNAGAGTTTIQILNTGNIGFATTTPGSVLQVNGNAAIGYSASTAAPTNGLAVSGNVGIGTNTPQNLRTTNLDVSNTSGTNGAAILISPSTNGLATLRLGNSGTHGYDINFNDATIGSGSIGIYSNVSNIYRLGITSNGEIQLKPSANTSVLTTTGAYSLTGSNAQSLIDLAGTWNTTGNPTAIKLNITNTASGASADLMELQVGGTNQFRVTKGGAIETDTPTTGTKKPWKLGSYVTSGSWTMNQSSYVEIEIDGVAYKLALVSAAEPQPQSKPEPKPEN